jgi:hypothetical protein
LIVQIDDRIHKLEAISEGPHRQTLERSSHV